MIILILFVFFIVLSGYLALYKPTYFVIYYFLVSTKMLGFFSVEDVFIIGGLGLGFFSLNIITLLVALFKRLTTRLNIRSKRVICFFVVFLLFGLVYPYFQENSSLLSSLMASKEFWSISFFIYLIKHSEILILNKILRAILIIGIYLSLIYIIFLILNIAPPYNLEFKSSVGTYARAFYPTYISLAVFIALYLRYSNIPFFLNHYITLIILFAGILLAGHTALMAGTLISSMLFMIVKDYKRKLFPLLFKISSVAVIIIILGFTFPKQIQGLNNEISMDTDNSLISRKHYNQFRWDAIEDQPLFGYGFLNQTTQQSNQLIPDTDNIYMQRLGVIDSGYLDLLIKFGYTGMVIYLIGWFKIIVSPFLKIHSYGILGLAMACYLVQYFMVNYTWSVFSYSHGLIPGFLALFIILEMRPVKLGIY